MDALAPLLGNTLIVVAHPDDEVIGFGALMQRMKKATVVFATDGAPLDQYFWAPYGSRAAYAEVRRQEARAALAIVGASPIFLSDRVPGGIADQQLFRRLPEARSALGELVEELRPECLLTLAYEGGHPDHDSACFLAATVGKKKSLPVWEGPLYHRRADGSGAVQTFPEAGENVIEVSVQGKELKHKIEMFHTYVSQKLVLDGFRPELEKFRPIADYAFTRPPLPWKLNYEIWNWNMTGKEVSEAFAQQLGNAASTLHQDLVVARKIPAGGEAI